MIPRTAESDAPYIEYLHAEGASHWGANWLEANVRACNALMRAVLLPNDYKLLGAFIAMELCRWRAQECASK